MALQQGEWSLTKPLYANIHILGKMGVLLMRCWLGMAHRTVLHNSMHPGSCDICHIICIYMCDKQRKLLAIQWGV